MGVHTEWARATAGLDLITEDEGWTDNHGQGLDAGNVGLAFNEVVVEGTKGELADFARRILALVEERTMADAAAKYMVLCQLFEQFHDDPTVPPIPGQLVPTTSPQARAYSNAVIDVLGIPFPGEG